MDATIDKASLLKKALEYKAPKDTKVAPIRVIRIENRLQKKRIASIENWSCQICGWSMQWKNEKGKTMKIIEVDHIIEKANGGTEEANNLWTLCPNCHAKKTYGVIKIDLKLHKIFENEQEVKLHHDNHLGWLSTSDSR